MGLVHIKGHLYYTRSIRGGTKVTSRVEASGRVAIDFAAMDRLLRERDELERALMRAEYREAVDERRAEREKARVHRERIASIHRSVGDYYRRVGKMVE